MSRIIKFSLLIILLSCVLMSVAKKADKPNILFILADDQCYNTVRSLGNDEIYTPTLDRLVEQGVSYSNAYNMGAWNGAVCLASRGMFNCGMTLWRACSAEKQYDNRALDGQMWGNLMASAGYRTYMTGKWHVHANTSNCFDVVGKVRGGMPNQTPEGYSRPKNEQDTLWKPWHTKYGGHWKGGKHWSVVVADETIEFLDQAKNDEKPFFMYVAFNAPHDPRQSPKRFVDMYPLEHIEMPKSFVPEYLHKQEIGCYKVKNRKGEVVMQRDENLAPFPRTEYSVKVNRQEYYAIITHMDEQVGRIMQHLEDNGMDENTYVFFTADHGLAVGNHGLIGKQNMFEHSMKAPLIVVGPRIPQKRTNKGLVYIQDIMATALDIAGVDKPEYIEFHSLLPKMKKGSGNYKSVYGAYSNLQRMVRLGDYKLIVYPEVPVAYLFNLKEDPHEMNNLYNLPKYKNKGDELFAELEHLQQVYGDQLHLSKEKYKQ